MHYLLADDGSYRFMTSRVRLTFFVQSHAIASKIMAEDNRILDVIRFGYVDYICLVLGCEGLCFVSCKRDLRHLLIHSMQLSSITVKSRLNYKGCISRQLPESLNTRLFSTSPSMTHTVGSTVTSDNLRSTLKPSQ